MKRRKSKDIKEQRNREGGEGEKGARSMSGASADAFETEYREIVPEQIQFKYKYSVEERNPRKESK